MDEYIQSYIDQAVNNAEIERDELIEILETYIEDRGTIEELLGVNAGVREAAAMKKEGLDNLLVTRIGCDMTDVLSTLAPPKQREFHDPAVKKAILGKYDLREVREVSANMALPSYLVSQGRKRKEKVVRYHNNQVVTCKGEKYIVEKPGDV